MTPGTVSSHRSSPSAMTGFWTLPAQRRRGLRSGQRGQVSHKRSFLRRVAVRSRHGCVAVQCSEDLLSAFHAKRIRARSIPNRSGAA